MILVKPDAQIIQDINREEILRKIEFYGRTCYRSRDKATSESSKRFVQNLIKRGHLSVIEHINVTSQIICDRGVTHELVRHRLCSYSQESTRYINYKEGVEFIIPLWTSFKPMVSTEKFSYDSYFNKDNVDEMIWFNSMIDAEKAYIDLIDQGWTPEKARTVLPNSLKSEIIMTTNLREYRHIFQLRTTKQSHPQIREVMNILLRDFKKRIPIIFDDIWEE
jgi:thymidylate synthase (FAD)